jgi:uncharacterized protein YceK
MKNLLFLLLIPFVLSACNSINLTQANAEKTARAMLATSPLKDLPQDTTLSDSLRLLALPVSFVALDQLAEHKMKLKAHIAYADSTAAAAFALCFVFKENSDKHWYLHEVKKTSGNMPDSFKLWLQELQHVKVPQAQ